MRKHMAWRVLSPYILHSAFSLSKGDCPKKVQPVQVITEKRELNFPESFSFTDRVDQSVKDWLQLRNRPRLKIQPRSS